MMNRLVWTVSVALLVSASSVEGGDWTQWRGPARTSQLPQGTTLPAKLSDGAVQRLWDVKLGPGYSGPIVAGDRVFVTETVREEREVVHAFDVRTGEELWRAEWPGAMSVPFFAASNGSWIRSTPAFDGERLIVAGMRDVLVALNGTTGEDTWRVDFTQEFSTPIETFGFVCSPLVHNGRVYVQTAAGLVCLESATGRILWRSLPEEGGMMGGAFSSPVIAEIAGQEQLVVQTRARLCGVDPEAGAELWSVEIPSFRGMNILTPAVIGDTVFTSSYGGGSFLFRITRNEDAFLVEEVWKKNSEAYMSSPVVVEGRVYLHLRNQRFTCLDPDTSEALWTTKPFGRYWSLVAEGDRLLALDERGDLRLIHARPDEYRELDALHVSDAETWAHLAVAGNRAYIRALDGLAVWGWE